MPTSDETRRGLVFDLPMAEYQASPALSNSDCEAFRVSPEHYLCREHKAATPAMLFGTVCHDLCLTPDAEKDWYVLPSGLDGRSSEAKSIKKENPGKQALSFDDFQRALCLVDKLKNHPLAKLALFHPGGANEVSAFATSPVDDNLVMRCRFDRLCPAPVLVDLKTTGAPFIKDKFRCICHNLGYHRKAAWYVDILNAITGQDYAFVFVVIEDEPPFGIRTMRASEEFLHRGRQQNRELMVRFAECERTGIWPGYPGEVEMLDLPDYVERRLAAEDDQRLLLDAGGWEQLAIENS